MLESFKLFFREQKVSLVQAQCLASRHAASSMKSDRLLSSSSEAWSINSSWEIKGAEIKRDANLLRCPLPVIL